MSSLQQIFELDTLMVDRGRRRGERYYMTQEFSLQKLFYYNLNEDNSLDVLVEPWVWYSPNPLPIQALNLMERKFKIVIPAHEMEDLVMAFSRFHVERLLKIVKHIHTEDHNRHFNITENGDLVTIRLYEHLAKDQVCCIEAERALGAVFYIKKCLAENNIKRLFASLPWPEDAFWKEYRFDDDIDPKDLVATINVDLWNSLII